MQFFSWIADNWQAVCGWSGGLYLAYHIGRVFVAVVLAINSGVARIKQAEITLSTMSTNHLPHIQFELEKTNDVLADIRADLRKVLKIEESSQE